MDALYHSTDASIQKIQEYFQKLEENPEDSANVASTIQSIINEVNSNIEELNISLFKAPLAERQKYKMRFDQLKYDNKHLQVALRLWEQKHQRKLRERIEREELLNKKFSSNPENTAINMDYSIQHQSSLQNAHSGIDDVILSGSSILDSLKGQRGALKRTHRRLVDMANTLGLSNATIRLIERRASEDGLILIGGMIVTILIIVLIIVYVA